MDTHIQIVGMLGNLQVRCKSTCNPVGQFTTYAIQAWIGKTETLLRGL